MAVAIQAGIGADITEVINEVGVTYTILRTPTNITGEKCVYDLNTQATKPFIREHQLDAEFVKDTSAVVGDVVRLLDDRHYLVMNLIPEIFEDEVVSYSATLYLCNLPNTACLLRPAEIRDDETYDVVSGWQTIIAAGSMYGLLDDRAMGTMIDEFAEVGQIQLWKINLIIPKSYDAKPLDRLYVTATEYYKIEAVESYWYPGCNRCLLVEDTRSANI